MAYTTIKKPSDYFNTVTYTGDGTSPRSITGVGFQPDFLWIKDRSTSYEHRLMDAVRGSNKVLHSSTTGAETSEEYYTVSSFDSDGWTGRSGTGTNQVITGGNDNGDNFVAWNWLANGAGVSNTDGSITSTVSANTTSGFSIVSYIGNATYGATVGHGLGSAPKMIIVKNRTDAVSWYVFHESIGNGKALSLNLTNASDTSTDYWNDTSPTSSVFSLGNFNATNGSSDDMIAYCFAEKKGFSKAFSYTGNGSTDGSFCYLGFRPAFIMIKSSSLSSDWNIWDNKRPDYNVVNRSLEPHQSDAETVSAGRDIDILSNGFKARGTSSSMNSSGATYVGIAFAESPLVGTNNTPATAR